MSTTKNVSTTPGNGDKVLLDELQNSSAASEIIRFQVWCSKTRHI